jgi:hypothetical protein
MTLRCKLRITLFAALIGFETTIYHLNGEVLPIKHEPMKYFGERLTIQGKGMPSGPTMIDGMVLKVSDNDLTYGDLVVDFDVVFPKKISSKQRKLLETIMDEDDIVVLERVLAFHSGLVDEETLFTGNMCHFAQKTCINCQRCVIINLYMAPEEPLDEDIIDVTFKQSLNS